ncbi:LPS export ABC transporter periplasmic protein LptC [Massilia sp. BJB1822]|uniref:LPS export ABC transporter periplasmic protein LptC n=1 Tax=Massilia sp. BJB1822 TaxID=2744470 RepID=UPI0015935AEC|nr:LPS export ABC transporter periplasmic protein LptC [Massilia sp. BJB1822]NVD99608.1 LPS export ABC transporter periplasmic protein LptC [Massilia sp. BJB1822]
MRQRTAHRFRLSIVMMGMLFLAFGSFWLLQLMNQAGDQIQASQRQNEPDYIVEEFSFVRMSKDGRPNYIISGDKLTHRPVDDSSEIDKPLVRSLSSKEQPPMDMRAQHARVDDNNSRVVLTKDVQIDRAAAAKGQPFQLRTEALTIYPDEDRMETDQPVQIRQGEAHASGSGLRGNNATRELTLKGRGTLVLPPKQH